jgi:hypothetical protein
MKGTCLCGAIEVSADDHEEAGARPRACKAVEVKAGQGILGDRFNEATGEALAYGELRRNVITQGVALCEPCAHLRSRSWDR